jgi:predicted phage gp36 major capsid-like protein
MNKEKWKHEYEVLDACCELAQGKIAELQAYKDVNEDFKTAWEELKAENERLKEEIKRYKNV